MLAPSAPLDRPQTSGSGTKQHEPERTRAVLPHFLAVDVTGGVIVQRPGSTRKYLKRQSPAHRYGLSQV